MVLLINQDIGLQHGSVLRKQDREEAAYSLQVSVSNLLRMKVIQFFSNFAEL